MTNETVQSLLIAAGYLGCESIIDAASEFIRQRISIDNVLEVSGGTLNVSETNFRLFLLPNH